MKINKKGFTLVELLAVVVILLAISVIAVSSISAAIERNKNKQNDTKIKVIISYGKLYYDEHKNTEADKCVEVFKFRDNLSDSEKVNTDNEEFDGVVKYNTSSKKWEFISNGSC